MFGYLVSKLYMTPPPPKAPHIPPATPPKRGLKYLCEGFPKKNFQVFFFQNFGPPPIHTPHLFPEYTKISLENMTPFLFQNRFLKKFLGNFFFGNFDIFNLTYYICAIKSNKVMKNLINSPSFTWFRKSYLKKIHRLIKSEKVNYCCHVSSWHGLFICWKDLKEVQENLGSEMIEPIVRVSNDLNCSTCWFYSKNNRVAFLEECLMAFKK